MASTIRPRRSVLYMPGSNARALEKGRTLAADGLILDMEDAVAPDAKQTAREQITAAIAEGGYGMRELIVRTNGLDGPWGEDDLKAAAKMGAHAVLLPKVESKAMVDDAIKILDAAGAPKALPIWAVRVLAAVLALAVLVLTVAVAVLLPHIPRLARAAADMPAGSVLFWMGGTLHGAGANVSEDHRFGLILSYSVGWLRQEENQFLSISPETVSNLSPELQAMTGREPHEALGLFDPRVIPV